MELKWLQEGVAQQQNKDYAQAPGCICYTLPKAQQICTNEQAHDTLIGG